jgi:hypothetical protein
MTDTLLPRLADALRECSDNLAALVSREYGGTQHGYDAQRSAYDRDMAPVERARALLAEHAASEAWLWEEKRQQWRAGP